ncbi:hypothetical protein SCB49_06747 [unidentified eubacterium SCB49]|nr:hypothetical protein SCB49_06747 [unidentified eubacterium SCB49]
MSQQIPLVNISKFDKIIYLSLSFCIAYFNVFGLFHCPSCSHIFVWWDFLENENLNLDYISILFVVIQITHSLSVFKFLRLQDFFRFTDYFLKIVSLISILYWLYVYYYVGEFHYLIYIGFYTMFLFMLFRIGAKISFKKQ